jgi:excisionase family DNA binding protein
MEALATPELLVSKSLIANEPSAARQVEPLVYTIPDACKLLSIARSSVYRLLDSGKLGSVTIGKRRLITAASIRALAGIAPQASA